MQRRGREAAGFEPATPYGWRYHRPPAGPGTALPAHLSDHA